MWTVRRSSTARPVALSRPGLIGWSAIHGLNSGRRVVGRHHAEELAVEPVDERKSGFAKPHRAFGMVSNTGWRSKAERLITSSTSAVAVCCCSDFGELRLSLGEFAPA